MTDTPFAGLARRSPGPALDAGIIAALRAALHEPPVRQYLARQAAGTPLLEWDGEAATLRPVLAEETLQLLEAAFQPRRRVARSWNSLHEQLQNCHTRTEWQNTFASWLDGGDNLNPDDEIALEE